MTDYGVGATQVARIERGGLAAGLDLQQTVRTPIGDGSCHALINETGRALCGYSGPMERLPQTWRSLAAIYWCPRCEALASA